MGVATDDACIKWGGCGCRVLTDELEQTRNMLQNLQDSLVQDDGLQLKVVHC